MNILKSCTLCPKNCNVDRTKQTGFCKAKNKIKIARAALHYYEEPCISGKKGSGTIFFSYCNLKCIFCQNAYISIKNTGKEITIKHFSEICLKLQEQGALNINLVTPTHYVPLIIKGLKLAKKSGLTIPIIYNTSAYENIETIKMLKGYIDIYLPDFKYWNNNIAKKYSHISDYKQTAINAIKEMYSQVETPKFKKSIIQKGVIVRHLVLPNHEEDSKKIIEYLYNTYKNKIYISIMNQYTPIKTFKYENLNHKIKESTYNELIEYAYNIGIRKAYVQSSNTANKNFIPNFKNQKF